MQTALTDEFKRTREGQEAEAILRKCVHCGFCTATCPTFLLLGDELDSPRGRIYLIKDMLESGRPATELVVRHIDRCLSCLSCMTTCPSGVHYMHLVDHARTHIEETYRRPWHERLLRRVLATTLPRPKLFRAGLRAGSSASIARRRRVNGLVAGMMRSSNGRAARPASSPARNSQGRGSIVASTDRSSRSCQGRR